MFVYWRSKKILLLIVTIIFFSHELCAQKIDSVLNVYADQFQQEKAYLQFDKPAYAPGETIWFKAYIMAGIYPSNISKNFYVDWIDEDGNLLLHTTAPIVEASARGQFEVPSNFSGKTIYVKAYTSWMLNFDSAFIYQKNIHIIQKNSLNNYKEKILASINFFPEGGDAINGIKNKIAFKANDQYGRPVKIKGVIQNNKGVIVDSLKVMHDGMGYFFLQPQTGETYTAKWFDEQKNIHETALPAAKNAGASLQINIENNKRNFIVQRTENVADNLKQLHVVATFQQQLIYMANINLETISQTNGSIPTTQLPTGILQITLFDESWNPLAERICFINNRDAIFLPEVGFSVLGLAKRGRNVLVIDVPDSLQTNLSVAVTDAGIGVDTSDNIIAHFLLTGDLKGNVFNPSYYFSDDKDAEKNLDLVMLTHGWRRFKWNEVVQERLPEIKYQKDTSYLNFSGRVFGASADQIRAAGEMIAIIRAKDSTQKTMTIPLRSDGKFSEPGFLFFDTLKIYYQFPTNLAEVSALTFSNGLLPVPKNIFVDKSNTWFDTSGNYRNLFLAQQQESLQKLLHGATLQAVTVTTKAKSPLEKLDEKYTSPLFQSNDAYQFDIVDDPNAQISPSVFSYLQGRVAGLMITINGTNTSLSWRGGTPQVFLDEMPVDVSQLNDMSMNDVAYVKVFRPPFVGSSNGAGGAIAIYTRKGGDKKTTTTGKGMPYKIVGGYTVMKEFYSPNYGTFDQRNEQDDIRSTLYWNPMILTSSDKHIIRLEFYNNDVTNSFRVVLEGMSKDGRVTRVEKLVQ
ncbi:MAG: hypothetical protein ACR2FN_06340 [Chitinophagaceae bacterium]